MRLIVTPTDLRPTFIRLCVIWEQRIKLIDGHSAKAVASSDILWNRVEGAAIAFEAFLAKCNDVYVGWNRVTGRNPCPYVPLITPRDPNARGQNELVRSVKLGANAELPKGLDYRVVVGVHDSQLANEVQADRLSAKHGFVLTCGHLIYGRLTYYTWPISACRRLSAVLTADARRHIPENT